MNISNLFKMFKISNEYELIQIQRKHNKNRLGNNSKYLFVEISSLSQFSNFVDAICVFTCRHAAVQGELDSDGCSS